MLYAKIKNIEGKLYLHYFTKTPLTKESQYAVNKTIDCACVIPFEQVSDSKDYLLSLESALKQGWTYITTPVD